MPTFCTCTPVHECPRCQQLIAGIEDDRAGYTGPELDELADAAAADYEDACWAALDGRS